MALDETNGRANPRALIKRVLLTLANAPYILVVGLTFGYLYVCGVSKSEVWVAGFWKKYGSWQTIIFVIVGAIIWLWLLLRILRKN